MIKKSTALLIDRHRGNDPRIGGVRSVKGTALHDMKRTPSEVAHRKILAGSLRIKQNANKVAAANTKSGAYKKAIEEKGRHATSYYRKSR